MFTVHTLAPKDIQGYPQEMRLQRRLYGFVLFMIPRVIKLLYLFSKTLCIPAKNTKTNLQSIVLKDISCCHYQYHPLRVQCTLRYSVCILKQSQEFTLNI